MMNDEILFMISMLKQNTLSASKCIADRVCAQEKFETAKKEDRLNPYNPPRPSPEEYELLGPEKWQTMAADYMRLYRPGFDKVRTGFDTYLVPGAWPEPQCVSLNEAIKCFCPLNHEFREKTIKMLQEELQRARTANNTVMVKTINDAISELFDPEKMLGRAKLCPCNYPKCRQIIEGLRFAVELKKIVKDLMDSLLKEIDQEANKVYEQNK